MTHQYYDMGLCALLEALVGARLTNQYALTEPNCRNFNSLTSRDFDLIVQRTVTGPVIIGQTDWSVFLPNASQGVS